MGAGQAAALRVTLVVLCATAHAHTYSLSSLSSTPFLPEIIVLYFFFQSRLTPFYFTVYFTLPISTPFFISTYCSPVKEGWCNSTRV